MGYADTVSRVLSGDYTDASPEDKAKAQRELVQVCSVAAAAVAIQPIPFLDSALIAPIQIAMVQGIGRIHGFHLDRKSILEILASFGASLVAQNVMMAAAKFVPGFGWVVSASMAYALTWAIGEVSEHYFRTGRGASQAELKEMFDRVYRAKRKEKEEANKGNETLAQRLAQLNEARKQGLLTEEEFERKKQEMLSSF